VTLTRIDFAENLLPKVQGFDCGAEPWQQEVSDWIKAPRGTGGAVDALSQGNQVWLYADPNYELVGFGSIGATTQRYPRPKDDPIPASVIPWMAVARRFWGQPPGPPQGRFSALVLQDLMAEAFRFKDQRGLLILFVHLDNVAGFKLYERAGFAELHKPYTDKKTGWKYKRMVLLLD
jgi:ribosomal protein S18 acetylase RimI-like enzyme